MGTQKDLRPLEQFVNEAQERTPSLAALQDRYRGVLAGVSVGNALGLPVEGWTRTQIARHFPQGVHEVRPAEREAPWDDDTAQTVLLADALLERGEADPHDLAARLLDWARTNGRGMGNLTRLVLAELAAGVPPQEAARRVWERSGGSAAGNGAVMRCAPVALRWRTAGQRLIEESQKSALVTHHDPRCVWSVVAFNVALARSLADAPLDLHRLAELLATAGAPPEVVLAVQHSVGCALADFDLDDPPTQGYTIKAMQVGLWALQQGPDFEEPLVAVVNAGGDTDTNGAVAGAALGSRLGIASIPQRWLQYVRDLDRLLALADRLLAAAQASDPM